MTLSRSPPSVYQTSETRHIAELFRTETGGPPRNEYTVWRATWLCPNQCVVAPCLLYRQMSLRNVCSIVCISQSIYRIVFFWDCGWVVQVQIVIGQTSWSYGVSQLDMRLPDVNELQIETRIQKSFLTRHRSTGLENQAVYHAIPPELVLYRHAFRISSYCFETFVVIHHLHQRGSV